MQQTDATVSGPMFDLPGGKAMAAVGLDVRTEKYKFEGDQRSNANTVDALIFNVPFDNALATAGTLKRQIKAVYGEVMLPVFKGFELTAAVRRDDYTGFGASTNPKVSMRYAPVDQMVFRGSYSTGFRVPTFKQQFDPQTQSAYTGADFADPAKCATRVVSSATGCESITPVILFGGKSTLSPEEAKMKTLGVVFQPNPDVVANLDWWEVNRTGSIQSLDLTTLATNFRLFPQNFIRDANGTLVAVDTRWVNTGESVTKGLEFGVRGSTTGFGARWTAGLDVSYLLEKRSRLLANAPFSASEVGVFSRAGDLGVRWKHTASITRTEGDWSATLAQVYRSGYADHVISGVADGSFKAPNWNPIVRPYEVYNLSVGYTGIKDLRIVVGVKNLLNEDPPFSVTYDTNTGAGSSWEPRVADPRGRAYTLRLEYKFF
jgi:iron complex outermembrane recepter protein